MKMTVTIRDKEGSEFSYKCPPDFPPSENPTTQWLRLECHQCPGCSLRGTKHFWCPGALSLADILESPLSKRPSYETVQFTVKLRHATWDSSATLDRALGLQILYRLATSQCPLFSHSLQFFDFFTPPDTHHKIIFQYLAINLMITNIVRNTDGGEELSRFDPERAAVVFEHMLMRIRSRKESIGDAVPNALCNMHAIFYLMQQDETALYGQLARAIS